MRNNERFGSLAAIVAGLMWVAYFGLDLIANLLGTRLQDILSTITSPQAIVAIILFNGAIIGFAIANVGLFRRLSGRARGVGIIGLVFAALAASFATLAFIAAATGFFRAGTLSAFGVMTTCLATTLMGIAVVMARALPGKARFLPLFFGSLIFPIVIIAAVVLGAIMPAYADSEIPFGFSGLGWILIGLAMRSGAAREEDHRDALVAA